MVLVPSKSRSLATKQEAIHRSDLGRQIMGAKS